MKESKKVSDVWRKKEHERNDRNEMKDLNQYNEPDYCGTNYVPTSDVMTSLTSATTVVKTERSKARNDWKFKNEVKLSL